MPWWFALILFAASTVLGALFRPKIGQPKPASLSEFDFPTADENRSVPKVYGTVEIKAPNVVDVFDFSSQPIVKKQRNPGTLFLTTTKQTLGYKYFIGMQMALSYQIDALLRIKVGEQIAWQGELTADNTELFINKPTLFKGDDPASGGNGGMVGYLQVHLGIPNAIKDAYLLQMRGNVSAHRRRFYVVWKGQTRAKGSGYLGNSTRIEPWSFVARCIPHNIPGAAAYANINAGDANPAEVIYDIMLNSEYAAGMTAQQVDTASFVAAAQTFFNDGLGFSALWDSPKACKEIINQILQLTDSLLYSDLQTGKMVLKPARADYNVNTLKHFDEKNILTLVSYSRGAWQETTNEVRVPFIDRTADFKQKTAQAQDLANYRIQTAVVSANVQHLGISNPTTGAKVAMRDLRSMTTPLAKITIHTNRDGYNVVPGQVFKWSWAKIKDHTGQPISNMVMRCLAVKYGDAINPVIEIEAIEDVFNSQASLYAAPPATGNTGTAATPVATTVHRLDDLPFFLGGDAAQVWAMAVAPNANHFSFDLLINPDGSVYDVEDANAEFTPTGTLVNQYGADTAAIDNGGTLVVAPGTGMTLLTNATASALGAGSNMFLIVSASSYEICAFETVTAGANYTFGNVWRGLLDTVPQVHPVGARVYFFAYGSAQGASAFNAGQTINGKILTRTASGVLDEATATAIPFTTSRRALRPYAPGNLRINGVYGATSVPASGDVVVAWSHRDRTQQNTVLPQNSTAIGAPESSTTYTLQIYKETGALLRSVTGLIATTYTYTNAQEIIDNGGALAGALTFLLFSTRDGLLSLQGQQRRCTRTVAPASVTYAGGGTYTAPPSGNATALGGVPVTGTPTGTNNTPIFNPATGQITWQPPSGGTLAGDVTGAAGANTVEKIRGRTVANASPLNKAILVWNSAANGGAGQWEPSTVATLQGRDVSNATPTANQVLLWNDTFSRWEPATIVTGGGAPSGAAGGDLALTYPNPRVDAIRARSLAGLPLLATTLTDTFTGGVIDTSKWSAAGQATQHDDRLYPVNNGVITSAIGNFNFTNRYVSLRVHPVSQFVFRVFWGTLSPTFDEYIQIWWRVGTDIRYGWRTTATGSIWVHTAAPFVEADHAYVKIEHSTTTGKVHFYRSPTGAAGTWVEVGNVAPPVGVTASFIQIIDLSGAGNAYVDDFDSNIPMADALLDGQGIFWNSGAQRFDAGYAKHIQSKGVSATVPTGGQALVYNSGTGLWEPATLSSAVAGAYGVDAVPAVPHALDEEFNNAGAYNGGYTRTVTGAVTHDINTTIPSHQYLKFNAASQAFSYRMAAPTGTGDFSVTVKFSMAIRDGNAACHIEADDTGFANAARAYWQNNSAGSVVVGIDQQTSGTWSFWASGQRETIAQSHTGVVLHLQRIGNVFSAWYSTDGGRSFMRCNNSSITKTLTIATIAIAVQVGTSTMPVVASIDWVRFNWRVFN